MRRPIPDRGMPHRATVERYTGRTRSGETFAAPITDLRANFNARRGQSLSIETGIAGVTLIRQGEVVLDDMDLPVLSKITNQQTGLVLYVGVVLRFDQDPVAPFLVVALGQRPS